MRSRTRLRRASIRSTTIVVVYWDAPVTLLVSTTSTLIGQIGGVNGLSVTVPASAARGWHIMTAVGLTTRAVTRSRFYVL